MSAPAEQQRLALQHVLARNAIANNLATHSRGVDRADALTMRSAYHSDATVAYGVFEGAAGEFCDFLSGALMFGARHCIAPPTCC